MFPYFFLDDFSIKQLAEKKAFCGIINVKLEVTYFFYCIYSMKTLDQIMKGNKTNHWQLFIALKYWKTEFGYNNLLQLV